MSIRGIIVDLDGTLYRGTEEVPGAARFVQSMRDLGIRCLFVTNRANRRPPAICEQLNGLGIPCDSGDVLTTAQAAAMILKQGTAFVIGGDALAAELTDAGIRISDDRPDYVVAGLDQQFTYEKLDRAANLIRRGARFVATNTDRMMTVEDGRIVPGAGSIIAAIAAASGHQPLVIGKPEKAIVEMALVRMGLPAEAVIMVGDSLETDMPAGARAGVRTALILTGVSLREQVPAAQWQPTWVVETYDELQAIVERERAAPPEERGPCGPAAS